MTSYPKVRELSEIERAWLAAALDGEGNIIFVSRKKQHVTQVRIVNTDLRFLNRVKDITGTGRIKEKKRLYSKPNWKKCFEWHLYSLESCSLLLKQLLPYLIIKADIAKQVILFADYHLPRSGRRYGAYEKTILKGDITEIEGIRRLL